MIILYCLISKQQPNNTDNTADGTENKPFHAHIYYRSMTASNNEL
jgi:hypothetical protein